jgi:2,4-dienoyl-CoA reductase-like NADH-dependent reductase (Old Yellow Enzyme family)
MSNGRTDRPILFTPLELRAVRLRNRTVVAPMCQYTALDGVVNDWHFAHLSQFATGGFGLIIVEATGVEERGRITHGCCGLWHDGQIAPLKRIVDNLKANGATPAIQLAHAGRKASAQRPWFGDGPLGEADFKRGDRPWEIVAPSALPFGEGWLMPRALSVGEIAAVIDNWVAATRRALAAGFDVLEIHSAHGYLSHSFLSPLSNRRSDKYGGSRDNRMRFTLELTEAVRAAWPDDKPLFCRVSAVDGMAGGWAIEDTVALAKKLKALGVDVMDCSSGGIAAEGKNLLAAPKPGYQVKYAEQVRREVDIKTQTVGLITGPHQAETILQADQADLVALAREALHDPYWPHHAAETLGADPAYEAWPTQYGWWLYRRSIGTFAGRPGGSDAAAAT